MKDCYKNACLAPCQECSRQMNVKAGRGFIQADWQSNQNHKAKGRTTKQAMVRQGANSVSEIITEGKVNNRRQSQKHKVKRESAEQ